MFLGVITIKYVFCLCLQNNTKQRFTVKTVPTNCSACRGGGAPASLALRFKGFGGVVKLYLVSGVEGLLGCREFGLKGHIICACTRWA